MKSTKDILHEIVDLLQKAHLHAAYQDTSFLRVGERIDALHADIDGHEEHEKEPSVERTQDAGQPARHIDEEQRPFAEQRQAPRPNIESQAAKPAEAAVLANETLPRNNEQPRNSETQRIAEAPKINEPPKSNEMPRSDNRPPPQPQPKISSNA